MLFLSLASLSKAQSYLNLGAGVANSQIEYLSGSERNDFSALYELGFTHRFNLKKNFGLQLNASVGGYRLKYIWEKSYISPSGGGTHETHHVHQTFFNSFVSAQASYSLGKFRFALGPELELKWAEYFFDLSYYEWWSSPGNLAEWTSYETYHRYFLQESVQRNTPNLLGRADVYFDLNSRLGLNTTFRFGKRMQTVSLNFNYRFLPKEERRAYRDSVQPSFNEKGSQVALGTGLERQGNHSQAYFKWNTSIPVSLGYNYHFPVSKHWGISVGALGNYGQYDFQLYNINLLFPVNANFHVKRWRFNLGPAWRYHLVKSISQYGSTEHEILPPTQTVSALSAMAGIHYQIFPRWQLGLSYWINNDHQFASISYGYKFKPRTSK